VMHRGPPPWPYGWIAFGAAAVVIVVMWWLV
jgi:hypothetical protein